MKTLIVVSGGDAPGINSAIARYTTLAQGLGDDVVGVENGFAGVLNGQIKAIELPLLRRIEGLGGTYLTSSREPVLSQAHARDQISRVLEQEKIDNILLFGGDGTLRHVLHLLQDWQIPVIGLPTTIDNDVAGTERTLGFDSACNYAYHAIEGILATGHALPGRIFMLETLGGNTGFLALEIAYAAGAHAVLVPEYEFDMHWFAKRLQHAVESHGFALAVLSEGVKAIPELPEVIPRLTETRLRYIQLGHAQRGGSVSHLDRRLAGDMARIAFRAFHDGLTVGAIVVRNGTPELYQDEFGKQKKDKPDIDVYNFVNGL